MFRNFVHEIVGNLSVEVGHRLQTMLPIVVWQTYGLAFCILHFQSLLPWSRKASGVRRPSQRQIRNQYGELKINTAISLTRWNTAFSSGHKKVHEYRRDLKNDGAANVVRTRTSSQRKDE